MKKANLYEVSYETKEESLNIELVANNMMEAIHSIKDQYKKENPNDDDDYIVIKSIVFVKEVFCYKYL